MHKTIKEQEPLDRRYIRCIQDVRKSVPTNFWTTSFDAFYFCLYSLKFSQGGVDDTSEGVNVCFPENFASWYCTPKENLHNTSEQYCMKS